MMVKRESFLRVGPFDARWRVGEFADWYLRATEMGLRVAMLPELLVWRRLHEANNWTRQRESRTDYLRVLKASLDRRRAAGLAHDSSAGNAPSVGNALVGDATGGVPPLSPDGGDEV
jgi:hypothetical protein